MKYEDPTMEIIIIENNEDILTVSLGKDDGSGSWTFPQNL